MKLHTQVRAVEHARDEVERQLESARRMRNEARSAAQDMEVAGGLLDSEHVCLESRLQRAIARKEVLEARKDENRRRAAAASERMDMSRKLLVELKQELSRLEGDEEAN